MNLFPSESGEDFRVRWGTGEFSSHCINELRAVPQAKAPCRVPLEVGAQTSEKAHTKERTRKVIKVASRS